MFGNVGFAKQVKQSLNLLVCAKPHVYTGARGVKKHKKPPKPPVKQVFTRLDHKRSMLMKPNSTLADTVAEKIIEMKSRKQKDQKFDYFLMLDFEATCDERSRQLKPQEIIEIATVKINASTFEQESIFHQYVKPEIHPTLTPFCTRLTNIVQDMVDDQPNFEETLQNFDTWMNQEGLLDENTNSVFVTVGDADLLTLLPDQCEHLQLPIRYYFRRWINLKRSFADVTGIWPYKSTETMLKYCKIRPEGKRHSAIADAIDGAKIMKSLAEQGYVFTTTYTR